MFVYNSSREFRENQKVYFDLAGKDKQVIVQRGEGQGLPPDSN